MWSRLATFLSMSASPTVGLTAVIVKTDPPSGWQAACEAAVAAEIANAEVCDRLLGATQRGDILTVLRNLHDVSQLRHLPALQRCAHGSAGGHGCGAGRGCTGSSASNSVWLSG